MELEQITALLAAFDQSTAVRLRWKSGDQQLTLEKAEAFLAYFESLDTARQAELYRACKTTLTPEYLKMSEGEEKYEEFPQGLHAISYDTDGKEIGSITCKYAKKLEEEQLWEARNEVVVINSEGKKLETELLYWDTQEGTIYSDRYVKLTADGQVIEGNRGFKSDQDLKAPVFYGITGEIEVEQQSAPQRRERPQVD